MSRQTYVKCIKCGKVDKPTEQPRNTGTSTTMRCVDCDTGDMRAKMCRNCCPTGHGTR